MTAASDIRKELLKEFQLSQQDFSPSVWPKIKVLLGIVHIERQEVGREEDKKDFTKLFSAIILCGSMHMSPTMNLEKLCDFVFEIARGEKKIVARSELEEILGRKLKW